MRLADLFFLLSVFFCVACVLRLILLAIRGNWATWRASALILAVFVALYAIALVVVSLNMPRNELAPGERRCFDDWCVAADAIERQSDATLCKGASSVWVASLEVSSVAKRIHQRASDAIVEVEDLAGNRYEPCAVNGPHNLRDMLGPGESLSISVPFALPAGSRPAGLVIHHGEIPGIVIIGDDQSWLHKPILFRAVVR